MSTSEPVLTIWVIYQRPLDYPEHYVLRAQHIHRPPGEQIQIDEYPTAVATSLDEVRAHIPHGLVCWPAQPMDHPTILETWF